MVNCKVITSDSVVWNSVDVVSALTHAAVTNQPITLDLIGEGPDFNQLEMTEFIHSLTDLFNYDLSKITVKTHNIIQPQLGSINFKKTFPIHLIETTREKCENKKIVKNCNHTFGMFIARSNKHRLDLASYLYHNHNDKTIQTFHYNPYDDFHKNNLGLESLMTTPGCDLQQITNFLQQCPIKRQETVTYPILAEQFCNHYMEYNNFLVEIVCETFFSGETFFPTEKTWRPIALETPFIVQGPQWYLHKLRDMGFQTFNRWWDEGYSEDPANWQNTEIKKVIDSVGKLSIEQLKKMYEEMQPILKHNKKRFLELTSKDFEIFNNDRY